MLYLPPSLPKIPLIGPLKTQDGTAGACVRYGRTILMSRVLSVAVAGFSSTTPVESTLRCVCRTSPRLLPCTVYAPMDSVPGARCVGHYITAASLFCAQNDLTAATSLPVLTGKSLSVTFKESGHTKNGGEPHCIRGAGAVVGAELSAVSGQDSAMPYCWLGVPTVQLGLGVAHALKQCGGAQPLSGGARGPADWLQT